jgi:exodeoxyribonuclease VII large subunit
MKTYIKVGFADKDLAKQRGARWDAASKQWFVPDGVDLALFKQWLPKDLQRWFSGGKKNA